MPNRLMGIGVIGLGTIGQTHLEALRDLRADEIVGADPSAAARARAEVYGARCFADFREMIASVALDGVVVATPPRTHREIATYALTHGLGVLCEKPLAVTLEDCEAIAAAVDAARGVFAMGFCHRFQPQVRALHKLMQSGALGRSVVVNIAFVHGLTEHGREWITDAQQAGGGVLFDSGSHAIDLFRHIVGDVDDVQGMTVSAEPGAVEDSGIVCLRSGGVLGSITLSWKTPPWQGLVEVVGTRGRARVTYDGERVRLRTRAGEAPWRRTRTSTESRFVLQMRHFLACVRGVASPQAVVGDGLEATRAILRIYDARRTSGTRGSFSETGHMSRTQA